MSDSQPLDARSNENHQGPPCNDETPSLNQQNAISPPASRHLTTSAYPGLRTNGPSPAQTLQAKIYKGNTPLASEVRLKLELWHGRHGSLHPPVASSSYARETRKYAAFGPHGERFTLDPYEVHWGRVSYGFWVLRRQGHPDAAVKCLTCCPGSVYYGIWHGEDNFDDTPSVVKIFQNLKTGRYPFVFEHHATAFGLAEKDKDKTSNAPQVSMRGIRWAHDVESRSANCGIGNKKRALRADSASESEEYDIPYSGPLTQHRRKRRKPSQKQDASPPSSRAMSAGFPSSPPVQNSENMVVDPKVPEDFYFSFISSGNETLRLRRIKDCYTAKYTVRNLFEDATEVFSFFDKISEVRCLSFKLKNSDTCNYYVLNANKLDFQILLDGIMTAIESDKEQPTWSVEVRYIS
ncbi:hypothetical protein DTO164E3_1700 [Paecilomyces variotii]|nr:hypothetical protein DTO164E3_1700 [Paecilomyces variotii]KAJ9207027.1 hypothetical protein DTO032I3_1615 [Paecilomyces variotii]KAJ9238517.1 hypothetical protein DTO169E5_4717 [Paecilomyces variotii]KAJ9248891.1 hypothetical protein DTO207G8_7093 [Paecilomyces variotii]KAJ9275748.1 hypothetical protein DTO021D3_7385 [Paecilomyces variotii]